MSLPPAQLHLAQQNGNQNGNGPPWGSPFPSLHLWPIQDTFAMKMIHLPQGQRIKIGRQTNNKTIPGERNAYFDSKVLSRTHAEIWEQSSKMYIKDLKSSNGTFVNNERLSPEGVESEPFEIKSEDIVEFGIDIVAEDNRSILHHKVAGKVYCVFGADDAALSARELVHYQSHDPRSARAPNPRPAGHAPGGPVLASGGKPNGFSFDHVLNKLQAELHKSKETGADLQSLATSMSDIQETLGGGLPPTQNGSAAHLIPPQYMSTDTAHGPHGQQAAAFISLQNQLGETQVNLTNHLEKINTLQDQVRDNQTLRDELAQLREQMEASRQEVDQYMRRQYDDDDDDDTQSVATLMDSEEASERVQRKRRPETHVDLVNRIQDLSTEVAEAVQATKSIQSQHSEAMASVRQLTLRIGELEEGIASRVADEVNQAEKRWEVWKAQFEDGWRRERETWEAERERLRGVVREWEESSRRGQDEVEERELNESTSGDDMDDPPNPLSRSNGRKARRRRPSHRVASANRALKAIAGDETGTTTPKAEPLPLNILEKIPRTSRRHGLPVDDKQDDSSESGRESGDTLKESENVVSSGRGRDLAGPLQRPMTIYVVIVAAIAGAIYYKQYKE